MTSGPRRLRRILVAGATAACAFLALGAAAVWVLSIYAGIRFEWDRPSGLVGVLKTADVISSYGCIGVRYAASTDDPIIYTPFDENPPPAGWSYHFGWIAEDYHRPPGTFAKQLTNFVAKYEEFALPHRLRGSDGEFHDVVRRGHTRRYVVPNWVLVVGFGVWPVWRALAWRRRRRRKREGLCVACGYDLRGADSDRCPECGTPAIPAGTPPPP